MFTTWCVEGSNNFPTVVGPRDSLRPHRYRDWTFTYDPTDPTVVDLYAALRRARA